MLTASSRSFADNDPEVRKIEANALRRIDGRLRNRRGPCHPTDATFKPSALASCAWRPSVVRESSLSSVSASAIPVRSLKKAARFTQKSVKRQAEVMADILLAIQERKL